MSFSVKPEIHQSDEEMRCVFVQIKARVVVHLIVFGLLYNKQPFPITIKARSNRREYPRIACNAICMDATIRSSLNTYIQIAERIGASDSFPAFRAYFVNGTFTPKQYA